MKTAPPVAVVRAFGVDDEPTPLPGGEGLAFRVGPIVLKRVHDAAEAEWVQALLARLEPDGFRVPRPIATIDGPWVVDGWTASEHIPGLAPLAPRWDEIIEWGLRFGAAAEDARHADTSALDGRVHRWAVADRVAWDEYDIVLTQEADAVRGALTELLVSTPRHERHFVHGDLAGNVFVDTTSRPVILDVSPYLRPRRWAAAIVVADAMLWHGADDALARTFASDPLDRDLLARALVFRLVADQLTVGPHHGDALAPYRAVRAAVS